MRIFIFILLMLSVFPAYAETIYIRIPVLADNPVYSPEDFAAYYLATIGENYLLNNMRSEAGINQMGGSTRITEDQAIELQGRWPMMRFYLGFPPANQWTEKIIILE